MIGSVEIHPVLRRIFFLCLILFVNGLLIARQAVHVQPSAGGRLETSPGKLVTVSFRVTNTSNKSWSLEPVVTLPRGWRSLASEPPFTLSPSQSVVKLINMNIPSTSPAGSFVVTFAVKDRSSGEQLSEAKVILVVTAVRQVEIRLLEAPRFVVAGEEYLTTFLITNRGNVAYTVRFAARSGAGFRTRLDSSAFHLEARESRPLTVAVRTDSDMQEKILDLIEILCELAGDSMAVARATSAVEVIPRRARSESPYFEYPLLTRLRAVQEGGVYGSQLELSGMSRLFESGKEQLEVLVRTPDIQARSILGLRDEYRLTLRGEGYEIYAGDRSFHLSPLTEFGRYAFGVGGTIDFGTLSGGGFYNETRFIRPTHKELGAFLNYKARSVGLFGLQYLRRNDEGWSDILTLRGRSSPTSLTDIDVEYGTSSSSGITDNAFSLRVSGREPWLAYDARYVDAGTNYRGYYRDVRFKTLALGVFPWQQLRIEAYLRDEERNRQRDTSLTFAPKDLFAQFGVAYADLISLSYRFGRQKDELLVSQFDLIEEAVQARGGFSSASFAWILSTEFGEQRNELVGKKNPFRRYSLFTNLRLSDDVNVNATFEYSKDRNIFSDETQERLSLSLSSWMMLTANTQVSATFFTSRTMAALVQTYRLIDVSIEHAFPWGHRLAVRARQHRFTPVTVGGDLASMIEYTVPLGVPLARVRTSASLSGTVLDAATGRGIPNVLVIVGAKVTATDREGRYRIPSLKPDTYFLHIDKATIGLDKIPVQQLPGEIILRGGEDATFDIAVTHGGTIAGTIRLMAFPEDQPDTGRVSYIEKGGHAGAVIELTNGLELQRRLSDARGNFRFTDVRPGEWKVRIVEGNLPEYHFLEKDAHDLVMKAGERIEVEFRVLPRRRRIQILQEGKVLQEIKPDQSGAQDSWQNKRCEIVQEGNIFAIHVFEWTSDRDARAAMQPLQRKFSGEILIRRITPTRFVLVLPSLPTRAAAEQLCNLLAQMRQMR